MRTPSSFEGKSKYRPQTPSSKYEEFHFRIFTNPIVYRLYMRTSSSFEGKSKCRPHTLSSKYHKLYFRIYTNPIAYICEPYHLARASRNFIPTLYPRNITNSLIESYELTRSLSFQCHELYHLHVTRCPQINTNSILQFLRTLSSKFQEFYHHYADHRLCDIESYALEFFFC